jgi:SAM-dependent methyltransferase
MDVRESYDSAAHAYAEHLSGELAHKPLDRHLLNRFVEGTRVRGLVADIGCGPGHVTRYLRDRGAKAFGIDISPTMVECASALNPGLDFKIGDLRNLDLPPASLAGVVLFYAIVHFTDDELGAVMAEVHRVLIPGGLVLVTFHIGDEIVHRNDLFGAPVDLDFRFHPVATVIEALRLSHFEVIEQTEREPYAGVEYQSRRGYLLGKAVASIDRKST